MRMPTWIRQHLAALRALLVFTLLLGVIYPLAVFAAGRVPGLDDRADGSFIEVKGRRVGSELIGQSFTGKDGAPLRRYFQSRPSSAGDGYDPTSTSASNLGPENIVDGDEPSLLTQVCARSKAVGELEGVDGSRPYCTKGGAGAVLAVFGARTKDGVVPHPTRVVSLNERQGTVKAPFVTTYKGTRVEPARKGEDYAAGLVVPIRGDAPARPAVPADAVTASGSGLDPDISPEYARLQVARVARARGLAPAVVERLVKDATMGRGLGFMGERRVNVLRLNAALDER
ncbi:potassium-transporting ATPase subunit C [Spirillospora sp. CA-294931]|uniref:potassium-transporting ATPase subunit C n=1 Tax=Spirillospora sp. CA-294931 TaxID=3240042 RepID=UPI003D92CBEC